MAVTWSSFDKKHLCQLILIPLLEDRIVHLWRLHELPEVRLFLAILEAFPLAHCRRIEDATNALDGITHLGDQKRLLSYIR